MGDPRRGLPDGWTIGHKVEAGLTVEVKHFGLGVVNLRVFSASPTSFILDIRTPCCRDHVIVHRQQTEAPPNECYACGRGVYLAMGREALNLRVIRDSREWPGALDSIFSHFADPLTAAILTSEVLARFEDNGPRCIDLG